MEAASSALEQEKLTHMQVLEKVHRSPNQYIRDDSGFQLQWKHCRTTAFSYQNSKGPSKVPYSMVIKRIISTGVVYGIRNWCILRNSEFGIGVF